MTLKDCQLCKEYSGKYSSSGIIHFNKKPNLVYNARFWRPEKVSVMFIGESPPFYSNTTHKASDGYFYNPEESQRIFGAPSPLVGTLSWNIFNLLGFENKLNKQIDRQLQETR